jgi:hypothetical protein
VWIPHGPTPLVAHDRGVSVPLECGNIMATIWQNVSEKGPIFATTFCRPFKDQSGMWHNGALFGLNDLEALMNVACEAKEWMTAHTLKR